MTKPKDQWLEENGISTEAINTMDKKIADNLEIDIEEGLQKEYGDFIESDEENQELPTTTEQNIDKADEFKEE